MTQKNIVSIDIGSCKTKLVVGRQESNTVIIEKAVLLDTPPGCQKDGNLFTLSKEYEQLIDGISGALTKLKLRIKNAAFTVQSTSIIRRELEMPRVKTNDLESMIRYEIEQYLPIDLSEYLIDYKVQEEKKEVSDSTMRVLIAAMPSEIASKHVELAGRIGLEPKVLDINSNAISKLFGDYDFNKTIALLDVGYNSINISIVSGGRFQFSRLIPCGASELITAVAEAYGVEAKEAEQKIISDADLKSTVDVGELNKILKSIVDRWSDDIQRVFQFYKTRNSKNNIDEIYLYGGLSNLRGMPEYMTKTMNMPVRRIKTISSIKMDKHCDEINLEYFLNAIGAIIRK